MVPAAQVQVAIGILSSFDKGKKPVADMLRDWGRKNRFAGSKDRAAIAGIVFETLRKYKSSAHILQSQRPRSRVLGAMWQYYGGNTEKCAELFDGSQYGPDRLNEAEMHRLETADLSTAPIDIRADFPSWLHEDMHKTFSADIERQLTAFRGRAPLDIRVNQKAMKREDLAKAWHDLSPEPMPYAPHGLRFQEPDIFMRLPNLESRDEFSGGLFDIQDESSQVCSHLTSLCLSEGTRLLDYCAGAGGKSLAVAGERPDVKITATDIEETRLKPLTIRSERAGLTNIDIKAMTDVSGQFECVLIDAPCSGSGTWRRKPESKWRLSQQALMRRQAEQKEALLKAKQYVSPGGVMIYATCSILASENSDQVNMFLQQNPDFKPVDWREMLPDLPGKACAFKEKSPFLQFSPASSGTDGFFIALLKRED